MHHCSNQGLNIVSPLESYGNTDRLREGHTCTKTNTQERFKNNTCIHQSSLPLSPLVSSLPNTPLCPSLGCVYILVRVKWAAACIHTRTHTLKVRCSSMVISLLFLECSSPFPLFFPIFLSLCPSPPISFVAYGTRSTSRTRPGSFHWNEPCGN